MSFLSLIFFSNTTRTYAVESPLSIREHELWWQTFHQKGPNAPSDVNGIDGNAEMLKGTWTRTSSRILLDLEDRLLPYGIYVPNP